MRLEMVEKVVGNGGLGPEKREVVGERREEDTQEEADSYNMSVFGRSDWSQQGSLRAMIMKVAKEPDPW